MSRIRLSVLFSTIRCNTFFFFCWLGGVPQLWIFHLAQTYALILFIHPMFYYFFNLRDDLNTPLSIFRGEQGLKSIYILIPFYIIEFRFFGLRHLDKSRRLRKRAEKVIGSRETDLNIKSINGGVGALNISGVRNGRCLRWF